MPDLKYPRLEPAHLGWGVPPCPRCPCATVCSVLPGVQGPCEGLGMWAQRRGKGRANKQNTQNEAPLCLIFLLPLLLVAQVKAAHSHTPLSSQFLT